RASTGAGAALEQEVERAEVTAATRDRDGRPMTAADKLTGVQLAHFGAFYRRSWRVNDWLWGRMDGVARLVETLLSPERLRQLGYSSAAALAAVRRAATAPQRAEDRAYLEDAWHQAERECADELAFLDGGPPSPTTLPACARIVARRQQTEVLRVELPRLAAAIEDEEETESPVPAESIGW